jgi:hypothetical protein
MTREEGNELLYLWKVGAAHYPSGVIDQALCATGDLHGRTARRSASPLLPVGERPGYERSRVVYGQAVCQGSSGVFLASAGSAGQGDAE